MKKAINTFAAVILSLFFIAIVLVIMIGVRKVQDADNGTAAFVFAGIEFLVLLLVFGLGRSVSSAIGVEMYAVLCTTTVIYVIIGSIVNCVAPDDLSTVWFTLINLALLFIYAVISVPLCVTGANSAQDRVPADPMNPRNMPDPYSLGKVNNLPNNAPDPRTAAPMGYNNETIAAAPTTNPIGFSAQPVQQVQQNVQPEQNYAPSQQPRNRQ